MPELREGDWVHTTYDEPSNPPHRFNNRCEGQGCELVARPLDAAKVKEAIRLYAREEVSHSEKVSEEATRDAAYMDLLTLLGLDGES